MRLDETMQRQAVMHGVADAMAGVTRLQIVDEVYDAKYWADYRAGVAAWQEAEQVASLPDWYRPDPPPAPDRYMRGALDAAPQDDQPFALRLLGELRASGEWTPGPTVLEKYQASRLAEIEREWAADPPEGFRDGPEAG